MIRGIDSTRGLSQPEGFNNTEAKTKTPLENQLKTFAKPLLLKQHKTLRKHVSKMLSDAQKGFHTLEAHEKKAFKCIEKHQSELSSHLHDFPQEQRMDFIAKEISKQKQIISSTKETVQSGTRAQEKESQPMHTLNVKHSVFNDNLNMSIQGLSLLIAAIPYSRVSASDKKAMGSFFQNLLTLERNYNRQKGGQGTISGFLQQYHYTDYYNGKKDPLLLCPQMLNNIVGTTGQSFRNEFFLQVLQMSPPTSQADEASRALAKNVQHLEGLSTNKFAQWTLYQIQFNSSIQSSMSGQEIFNNLLLHNNIFTQCPGVTLEEVQETCTALNIPPMKALQFITMYLSQINYPKGSAIYALQQIVLQAAKNVSSLSGLQSWVNNHLVNGTQDLFMQIPGITPKDIQTIFSIIKMQHSSFEPTSMDKLFMQVYAATQKNPNSKIIADLYNEIQKLGSASEKISSLQHWGAEMLSSSDYLNASITEQVQFCSWTGNQTFSTVNYILNQWAQSSDPGESALAHFLLGKKFTSLQQMRSFFNPNSPNFGFAKYDLYFQCPALLNAKQPDKAAQNLIIMLFTGSSAKPNISAPTSVDQAYAKTLNAAKGATTADLALYNLVLNQCKLMGSSWGDLEYWIGWQMLSSVYSKASQGAQGLFASLGGINDLNKGPLKAVHHYLESYLKDFESTSPTYQFLNDALEKLDSLVNTGGSWSDFQAWTQTKLSIDDLYMFCPDAGASEIQGIYQYLEGPDAVAPAPTQNDLNYIKVFRAISSPAQYSGNIPLYEDLLQAMLAVGSQNQDQAGGIRNYFGAHHEAKAKLISDWNAATIEGRNLFKQYTNQWIPT